MRNKFLNIICLSLLSGCNSVIEVASGPADASYRVDNNYQASYARLIAVGRKCSGQGTFAGSTYAINTDLFPDLGYGEISYTVQGMVSAFTSLVVRVEQAGTGTQVTIYSPSDNPAAMSRLVEWQKYWINGGNECQMLGAPNPPAISAK